MLASETKTGLIHIRPAWIIWFIVSFFMIAYIGLAHVASQATTIRLKLDVGNVMHAEIFRLFDTRLRFGLVFQGDQREQRPELGSYRSFDRGTGLLKFYPGAEVHILASVPSSPPLKYEAIPLRDVYRRDQNYRWMTADVQIEPGVYRWLPPPSVPTTSLHTGFNSVRFEVSLVGEPLAGETVDLVVSPPLGVQEGETSVAWLWFGLFWPLILGAQIMWFACLCHGGLHRREVTV